MLATSTSAAHRLRSRLIAGSVTPQVLQAALNDSPPEQRDAWLDLLWDIDEIPDDDPDLPRGCVPYLPCPVATVVNAVHDAGVTPADVFVDIGAGTGRTAFLAHVLTGAASIGIEIQPALVRAAVARADWLNLSRLRFIEGDAVDWVRFVNIGSVFFLYCPFSGERLDRFLDALEDVARVRCIRICSVDLPLLDRQWLARMPSTAKELHVYQSTLCP